MIVRTQSLTSMLLPEELPSLNKNSHDNDSLTDVSNDDQTLKSSQLDKSIDDVFFQSLIAYANSFTQDETVYSIHDLKNQLDSTRSIRRKSSKQNNNESTAVVRPVSRKLIPSHFFSMSKTDDSNSDENTIVTDQSKFQWEHLSDTTDHSKTLSNDSKEKFSLKSYSSPIIICEKTKNRFLPQDIDIQILRSPTPIIVREIVPKPSLPKNRLPLKSNTFTQPSRLSKPPIIPKSQANDERLSSNQQPKKIIIEYDQLNIKVNKNIKQRKEIKRIHPNEYVQQYGSSLYSREAFHNLFTNIIS